MKNYAAFIILSLLFINTTLANEWTGRHYTSNLKVKAAELEKNDPTAAFEHYLELASFYQRLNTDSVKYFLAKSLSVALLANDNNLIAISWLKHKQYLAKQANPTAIANAKQYASLENSAMLKCLVELYENGNAVSQKLIDKADELLIANEKNIEKANETDKLIFILLQEERANAGFSMSGGYKYPADINLGLKISKSKNYFNCYMTLLSSKAMIMSAKAYNAEAFKVVYEYKEQAKKMDNIVYYQASLINVARMALEAKRYDLVENECNELIGLALSEKHRSKAYSQNRFTNAFNLLFMAYSDQAKYDKALIAIEKCIYYSDSLAKLHYDEDSLRAFEARQNLGVLYYLQGNYQKAASQFLGIINKYGNKLDYVMKATLNNNIGETHILLGEYATALKYLNLAQPVMQELGLRNMASFYKAKRDAFRG